MNWERKWISREEIAEIHDARAKKLAEDGAMRNLPVYEAAPRVQSAIDAARNIRATERLSNPVGSRT